MRALASVLCLIAAAACARGEAATSLRRVVVDTLPNGVRRTVTERPVGWNDTTGWRLVEVARITGGVDGPGDLVDPQSVAMAEDGTIFVADQSPAALKEYTPTGTYVRTIAREGQGPGEFQTGFIAVHGGTLYLHDPRQSRTNVFDTSGTFVRSWPSSCCYWTTLVTDSAGNVGVPGMPPHDQQQGEKNPWQRTIHWFRPDSTLADTTLIPAGPEEKVWEVKQGKHGMMFTSVPFSPSLEFGVLPDRRVVLGHSSRYALAVTERNGADTVALFGRAWIPAEVSEEARHAVIEGMVAGNKGRIDETSLRNAFVFSDIPATAPAFDWMGTDGAGDLWIRTPVPGDSTRSLFDVFDPQYRWLGEVAGSRYLKRWGIGIVGDRMYGYGEDEEGNPVVVVYRIQREG
ncbi:MAG TPA: hypothetical protein VFI13_04575 [Gemmatimonadales bacterium]|nr:hypothetical protein [Gemmatimonadales bacterium]